MEKNNAKKNLNWKFWAGLLISALFLYLALKNVDFDKTVHSILSADVSFLLLAVSITFIQFLMRAWRWKIILNPLKDTGFLNRFYSVLIGFAANCVLPARLGELIRANSLGQSEEMSKSSVFGTLVIERLFDAFALLLIIIAGLMFSTMPGELDFISENPVRTVFSIFAAIVLVAVFIKAFRSNTGIFIEIINRLLFMLSPGLRSKIADIIEKFAGGFTPIKGPGAWTGVITWSLLLWALSLCQIYCIELATGIELPFTALFILQSMAVLGVAVPSAPGYVGTFHLAVQHGFMFYGISNEEAFSAATLLHASFFFPTILFGCTAFLIMQSGKERTGTDPVKKEILPATENNQGQTGEI